MKTKLWKNIISSFFLALFCVQNILADDVRLKISETTINNITPVPNVTLVDAV